MQKDTMAVAQSAPPASPRAERRALPSPDERFYLLDVLRGIAALAVVVWHYQHFFFVAPDTLAPGFTREVQPFYSVLWLAYEHGDRAVQLFFALSGFIFFYQYREAIRTRSVSAGTFFIYRFSRLYPLHIATLLIVALGQLVSRQIDGQLAVYPCNDWLQFGLNLFLVTEWMPKGWHCYSFNAPVWSISVEVMLYALFYGFALMLPRRLYVQMIMTALVILFAIVVALNDGPRLLGEPLFCFFAGGFASLLLYHSRQRPVDRLVAIGLALILLAYSVFHCWSKGTNGYVLGIGVYPAVILLLALLQSVRRDLGRSLHLLGDISYSTYLLHFPVQLGLILLVKSKIVELDFTGAIAFLLFFGLVLAVSIPSYYRFERPMQNWCRRSFLPAKKGTMKR